ncbi:MAG TPA: hypothetical protein VN577_22785 [Terriglobales bacterium]|nr:hypothetical protein [Terriglobales bacterium]
MKPSSQKLSRREFAKTAALGTAAITLPAKLFSEQEKPAPEATKEEKATAGPKLSPASQGEADATYDLLMKKYGGRFTAEQKQEIRRLVNQQQSGLDKLRAFQVGNGDEPATVFQPYRGEVRR